MDDVMKRRMMAGVIDEVINNVASEVVEQVVLKRIKSKTFHALVTKTVVSWVIEGVQLKLMNGQTLGDRALKLRVQSTNGLPLTTEQIVKRILYRETVAPLKLFKDRSRYMEAGARLPQDEYAETIVVKV